MTLFFLCLLPRVPFVSHFSLPEMLSPTAEHPVGISNLALYLKKPVVIQKSRQDSLRTGRAKSIKTHQGTIFDPAIAGEYRLKIYFTFILLYLNNILIV
jgi:hypothetical protein